MDLNRLEPRQLQLEAARALATMEATNNNIHQFNKMAHHDSRAWYKAVIVWYMDTYGNLPSLSSPGKDVKLVLDNV